MLKPTFSEHFWFCQISGFKKEESSEKSTSFITFWLMLVWNIAVPLSWGLLKCNHFGGQQLHRIQDFIPHFHDSLTWPPAGKDLLLPVALLKPHPVPSPHGCGFVPKCHSARIRAVRLNSNHKVEEKVLLPSYTVALQGWRGLLCSGSLTLGLQQEPRLP